MKRWFVVTVLALAGCEKPATGIGSTVNLVKVPAAGGIQPGSTWITLTATRELRRDGVAVACEGLPARLGPATHNRRETPILIEADASLKIGDLLPLLDSLFKGSCVNLSFLVATDHGSGALNFPVVMEHMCHDLWYWDGSREHHDSSPHLWIEVRPGPLRLVSVTTEREPFLVSSEPDKLELIQPSAWPGERPPAGPCSEETLKSFLARPDVAALSPFIRLHLVPEDSLDSALATLSALRRLGLAVLPEVYNR